MLLFCTVCTGRKQLCDLDAHGRCWVPYGGRRLQLTHNWSMPHHTPTLGRQQDQEDAAGLTCETSGPSKGGCLLVPNSLSSEPSTPQTQHLNFFLFKTISLVNRHYVLFDQYSVKAGQMQSFWMAFPISVKKNISKRLSPLCPPNWGSRSYWSRHQAAILVKERLIIFVSKLAQGINKKLPTLSTNAGSSCFKESMLAMSRDLTFFTAPQLLLSTN